MFAKRCREAPRNPHRYQGGYAAIPYVISAIGAGASAYAATKGTPKIPTPPKPPTQDTAANAANQQQDLLNKRRGVLANIYAGQQTQAPPAVQKVNLGD